MGQYLIDTNIISNLLTGNYSAKGLTFLRKITDDVPSISVITEIEILSWKADEDIESIVKNFVSDSNTYGINDDIVEISVELRRKRNIKTPDAIIAATAIANNLTLITANEKDFQNIKGLKLINPDKL